MNDTYDAIIVGGGMVGATIGCSLGNSGLKVAIIEQLMPKAYAADQNHDLRVSALSIASMNILQTVGAWQGIEQRRLCPYRRMRVWENQGNTEFCSDDINRTELGFIVENRIIQLALLDRLQNFKNVTFFCPESIKSINYCNKQSQLELAQGKTLNTRLLIAADGGESQVRKVAGLGISSRDYKQHALVISVVTQYAQQDITWQRFVPSGPQAFLPLSGNHGSIVWYNSPDEIQRLKKLTKDRLLVELTVAFPACLGKVKAILAFASFPLKRQHALNYVKQGVALIGDAAHMINPLAGQGVNIGLLDAAALAQVLVQANARGENIADLKILKQYEVMRRPENLKIMNIMEAFYLVFSNQSPPLKLIRNLGLGIAECVGPVKNKVMRYAMGLEGKLPKLAKSEPII